MKVPVIGAYTYNPADEEDRKATSVLKKQYPNYMEVLTKKPERILIVDDSLNKFNGYVMDKAYKANQIPFFTEDEFRTFASNEGISAVNIKNTKIYEKVNFNIVKRAILTGKRVVKSLIKQL